MKGGYDPAYFETLFLVEEKHFWFQARNRAIAESTRRVVAGMAPGYRVLEVGCGTGRVLRLLIRICRRGTVVGMDLFGEALIYARRRITSPLIQGDINAPPFTASFDLIGLFDVLEHLPNDLQALRNLKGMLRENGLLLLTVPAYPMLWSYFDEAARHCRRYRLCDLKRRLDETGFDVEYSTPFMMSLFPLLWIGRRFFLPRRRGSKRPQNPSPAERAIGELRPRPLVDKGISFLLDMEGRWLARGHTLPLGTSLLIVAKKRG